MVLDVVLGVIGAIVGGLAFNVLGLPRVTDFNLYSLFVAVAGSVLLLMLYHSIFRSA